MGAERNILIVSPLLPPHMGGVERMTGWMRDTLPGHGFTVRLAGYAVAPGEGDLMWPPLAAPMGIPIPRPSVRMWRRLMGEVRWADAVVIHNAFYPLSNLAGIAARRCGRPALTIVHANTALPSPDTPGWVARAEALHAATLGRMQIQAAPPVGITACAAAFASAHYGAPAGVIALPLPDDLPAIRDPHLPDANAPLQVVFSARLAAMKAPADAIAACRIASGNHPIELHVLGDGPLRSSLEADAPPWVTFHGALPWNHAIGQVRAADLYVSSSVTDIAQTSLLEALAMGVPATATTVGAAASYLSGGMESLQATPGEPATLAAAITRFCADPARFDRAARKRATTLRAAHNAEAVAMDLVCRLNAMTGRAPAHGDIASPLVTR